MAPAVKIRRSAFIAAALAFLAASGACQTSAPCQTSAGCQPSAADQVSELRRRAIAGEAGGLAARLEEAATDPVDGQDLRLELNRALRVESDPAVVRVMLPVLVRAHRFGQHPVDDLVTTFDHLLQSSEGAQVGVLMASIKFAPSEARVQIAPAVAEVMLGESDPLLQLGWLEVLHSAGAQGRVALQEAIARSSLEEIELQWARSRLDDWPPG